MPELLPVPLGPEVSFGSSTNLPHTDPRHYPDIYLSSGGWTQTEPCGRSGICPISILDDALNLFSPHKGLIRYSDNAGVPQSDVAPRFLTFQ